MEPSAHLAPEQLPHLAARALEPRADLGREVDGAVRLADDRVVALAVVLQKERDVVVDAAREACDVQDDGGGARLERPRVEVDRLPEQPRDAAEQRVGRADQLVEEQVVRRAEERRRRRRHVDGFEPRLVQGQVVAGLEEHGVEQLLQLRRLERVDAVVGGEEGDDERDAEVRRRQVREQQLGVVLAQRARVADVELAKVGQFPHVEHVVLRLDELGLRVLRRVGEVGEAVEGRHLAALELRPADERRVAVRGDLEAEVVRVPREHELGVALRVRRLRREARELRVEEVLRVEDDVAVPVEEGWNVRELRRIAP